MLEPGTMVEGYEVIRLAGSGAMSDVYEGQGASQVQRVAIKVLHEEGVGGHLIPRKSGPAEGAGSGKSAWRTCCR